MNTSFILTVPRLLLACISLAEDVHIDLSPLFQETGPWHVADDGSRFDYELKLEVCAPIRQLGHLAACPMDSAVCGLKRENSSEAIQYGRASTARLSSEVENAVGVLEFVDGDICRDDQTKRYRTLVHLACTPGVHGASPRFFAYDRRNCTLHLEWHTSVVCPQGNSSRSFFRGQPGSPRLYHTIYNRSY